MDTGEKFRTTGLILEDCKFYIAQNVTNKIIDKNKKTVQSLVYGKVVDVDISIDEVKEEIESDDYVPVTYNPFKVREYIKSTGKTPNYDNPDFEDLKKRQQAHKDFKGEFDELNPDDIVSAPVNEKFSCGLSDKAVFFYSKEKTEGLVSNMYMLNPRPCGVAEAEIINRDFNRSVVKFASN